jgi:hypothetical protein
MLAQAFHVGDQVMGGVGGQISGRVAGVGHAPATVALVEQDDAVALGIEDAALTRRATRARASMNDQRWLALGITADLPVDEMAVAGVEMPVAIRLDRRIHHPKISVRFSMFYGYQPSSADKGVRPRLRPHLIGQKLKPAHLVFKRGRQR